MLNQCKIVNLLLASEIYYWPVKPMVYEFYHCLLELVSLSNDKVYMQCMLFHFCDL